MTLRAWFQYVRHCVRHLFETVQDCLDDRARCGSLRSAVLLQGCYCIVLSRHPLVMKHRVTNNVAANMHVSSLRSYTPVGACVNSAGRMRCTFAARSLLRPRQGRTGWNVLSTTQCNAALAAAEPAPTVRNLATGSDKPKGKRWENVDKWVMFSDLHVSVKTLSVCISVLRKIKKEAVARKAGIVFLGNTVQHVLCCIASSRPNCVFRRHDKMKSKG